RIENRVGGLRRCSEQPQRLLVAVEALVTGAAARQDVADAFFAVVDVAKWRRGSHRSTPCRRRNPSARSILSVVSTAAPARRRASWLLAGDGESMRPGAFSSMKSA